MTIRQPVALAALLAVVAGGGYALGRAKAPPAANPATTARAFVIHTASSAPEASRPTLSAIEQKFGFLPNMLAVMSESPAALNGYMGVSSALGASTLTPAEQIVAQIAASTVNQCTYCVPAHATMALGKGGMTQDQIDAIELDKPLADARLEAVRVFTRSLLDARGAVSQAQLDAFMKAGFSRAQALDIAAIAAQKTLSNYTNGIAHIPSDEAFAEQAARLKANSKPRGGK